MRDEKCVYSKYEYKIKRTEIEKMSPVLANLSYTQIFLKCNICSGGAFVLAMLPRATLRNIK
jgi:hypothetical protein